MTGERFDFTALRLGSRDPLQGRKVVRCPRCGRKGLESRYKDGSALYAHAGRLHGGMFEVTDSCYVSAPSLTAGEDV